MARRAIFRTGRADAGRVEAFSDGVMAVAITLLVLDVKLPETLATDAAIWAGMLHVLPVLASWMASFAFILVFWVNHHYFFASLNGVDRGLLWLNGFFLLSITLIPFPTGLAGAHPGLEAPLALLSGAMMLTSLAFAAMRAYASFHSRLLQDHMTPEHARRAMIWSAVAPVLYAIAAGASFVAPAAAIAIQIVVLVFFFLRSPARHASEEA